MSREKECKCCHEWWYASVIKEDLCPNCYDYFKQLKQELKEKDKQIDIVSRDNNSYKYNIDEQKRIIHDFAKQLKEKDKEIEELKQQNTLLENENGKLTTELIMDKYKKAQKEVSFGIQLAIQELEKVKTLIQNAINFEKPNFVEVYDAINKQIKELKGEKDVKD